MINGIQLKICGLTTLADALAADKIGAGYLGFILWPKSPRYIPPEAFGEFSAKLPMGRKKVAVLVEPSLSDLRQAKAAGFDRMQIHFHHTTPLTRVCEWPNATGAKNLCLAPKLPADANIPPEWLPLADAFLLDAFDATPGQYGGTGRASDWKKFARHRVENPGNLWILAGGLTPENIAEAVHETGARFVDVNSGVETTPGVKDHEKLQALARALRQR
jgi:phosphoribosylanthranilate isomerase